MGKAKHPAKYTDSFIPIFYGRLKDGEYILTFMKGKNHHV